MKEILSFLLGVVITNLIWTQKREDCGKEIYYCWICKTHVRLDQKELHDKIYNH